MSSFAPSPLPQVAPPDPTKHVNYSLGMVLGVDDFTQEFAYLSGHGNRIVRDLIGYGVTAGLRVSIDVDPTRGPRVQVAPGEAVTPSGRLLCVSPSQCAYLNDWLQANRDTVEALGSPPSAISLAVVACYRECETDDVPIPGEPCRTESELMAASRLAESFTLDLRLAPTAQLEEDAVRDFVAWVRSLPVTSGPGPGVDAFLASLRSAADLEGSPAASPPSLVEFLLGSPPSGLSIPREDMTSYVSALFRFWVEELRPRLRSPDGAECGCGAGGLGELDPDADCVTLAFLDVPVAVDGVSGQLLVADTPDVAVDDSTRPTLMHLRLLQEWLLSEREVAIEARVDTSGNVQQDGGPALSASLVGSSAGIYLLQSPALDSSTRQMVIGTPEAAFSTPAEPSTFEVFPPDDAQLITEIGGSPPPDGVVVRALRSDGTAAPFSVRIVQLGAGS
jgi:hypothetical protein